MKEPSETSPDETVSNMLNNRYLRVDAKGRLMIIKNKQIVAIRQIMNMRIFFLNLQNKNEMKATNTSTKKALDPVVKPSKRKIIIGIMLRRAIFLLEKKTKYIETIIPARKKVETALTFPNFSPSLKPAKSLKLRSSRK